MPAGYPGRELLIKGPQGPKNGLCYKKGHISSGTTTLSNREEPSRTKGFHFKGKAAII